MKTNDVKKLNPGDDIHHKVYGLCAVKEVIIQEGSLFGVVVTPKTEYGKNLLMHHSGTNIPDLLEVSIRVLQPAA